MQGRKERGGDSVHPPDSQLTAFTELLTTANLEITSSTRVFHHKIAGQHSIVWLTEQLASKIRLYPWRILARLSQRGCGLGHFDHTQNTQEMEAQSPALTKVLVASCKPCSCSSGKEQHLCLSLQSAELDRIKAVAISYTWGEFDRRDVYIGHSDINPDKKISINLGQEWSIPELSDRLCELSTKHSALWMDQLCIPQNSSEIRKTLAKIPDIYRTLDVVAVLPGRPPCKCFNDWFIAERNRWLRLGMGQRNTESIGDLTLRVQGQILQCYSSVAFCSWYRRVWTRQEFFYSQTITITWCSKDPPPCVPCTREEPLSSTSIGDLNPYARLFLENAGGNTHAGREALFVEYQSFVTQGSLSALYYLQDHGIKGFGGSHLIFPLFIIGTPLTVGTKSERIDRFLNSLSDHSMGERSATKARDYVVSVWTDCPSYSIPANYESMDVLELLEDAIRQFEANEGKTFATTCPQGLLGGTEQTICWRPDNGLQSSNVHRSRHLYAPARTDTVLPLRNNLVPLRKTGTTSTSISSRAEDYKACCSTLSTAEMLYYMVQVTRNWNTDSQSRLSTWGKEDGLWLHKDAFMQELEHEGDALEAENVAKFERIFLALLDPPEEAPDMQIAEFKQHWKGFPELDHYALVYRTVAYVLGVDYEACMKAGLRLLIARETPAMIGLIARNAGFQADKTVAEDHGETLTIWTGEEGAQKILYEAIRHNNDNQGLPQYRVAGVWVPCSDVKEHDIGAVPSFDDEYDAVSV